MPICPRCGKILCNEQSLQNHLSSQICKANQQNKVGSLPKRQDTVTRILNTHDYDYWYSCDFKGNITYIDPGVTNVLKYSSEELIAYSGYDTIYQNDKFYVSQCHISAIATKVPEPCIFRRITKDGIVIPIKSNGILNESIGEIIVYEKLICFQDLSAINIILNKDFTYAYVNDKFTEIYGYTLAELNANGTKYFDLWVFESEIKFAENVAQFVSKKGFTCKHTIINKHNKQVQVQGSVIDKGNFYMISSHNLNI
jgi:PAS domain-containing protein